MIKLVEKEIKTTVLNMFLMLKKIRGRHEQVKEKHGGYEKRLIPNFS